MHTWSRPSSRAVFITRRQSLQCLTAEMLCPMRRSDTSRSELAQLAKQANPDEIDIDDDDDDDENGGEEEQGPEGRL